MKAIELIVIIMMGFTSLACDKGEVGTRAFVEPENPSDNGAVLKADSFEITEINYYLCVMSGCREYAAEDNKIIFYWGSHKAYTLKGNVFSENATQVHWSENFGCDVEMGSAEVRDGSFVIEPYGYAPSCADWNEDIMGGTLTIWVDEDGADGETIEIAMSGIWMAVD